MGLEEAHELVSLLLTPLETPAKGSGSDNTWFQTIISRKVSEYSAQCGLSLSPGTDIYFDYVRCCVNALINLRFELTKALGNSPSDERSLAADSLSIGQQKNVLGLVQMILALGVLPNLLPGVGTPATKRSVFLQTVIETVPDRSILERYKQLVFSTESLLELAKYKQLNALIVTKQLVDILACLIQLSRAPLSKPELSKESSPSAPKVCPDGGKEIELKEDSFVMTSELYERLSEDQARFGVELTNILERSYQPLIVRSLLVLLSGAEGKAGTRRPPKWFTKTLQALLSSRLVMENGVKSVVRGVMDLGGEGGSFDWTKVNMVASVLGSPPQGKYADTEKYYSQICPQLLELMESEDNTVSLIACTSIKTVVDRYLILSRRYLLDPLLQPLLNLTQSYEEALSVTEQQLDDTVKNLMKVFVLANDPSMMFVTHLEPVILVLLNLHMAITFGVSHLKDPVKQLIDRYLRFSDKATTLKVLRAFAVNEAPDTTQTRVRVMQRDVMFSSGEGGGVKVIKMTDSEQSFHVTDDEKAIVIQDLLEEQKDKALAAQFFLCIMEDLTVMVEENKDGFDVELPNPGEGEDVEKQILDLEDHLDTVMHRMRKNLMILRLLGLLSEDKSIEENLLKESDKMIQFVSVTVKRAAERVRCGVVHSNLATQSLNMSLSILTVHLTRADLPSEDWIKMIDIMEDLDTLSDHSDERISLISGQLHKLVQTQKIVIDEIDNLKKKTVQIQEESKKIKERVEEIKQIQVTEENKAMDERKAQLKQKAEELKKQKELRKNKVRTKYEEALFNIGDPLIPVQGHGLIQLTRLLEEKDEETLKNIDKVRLLFQSNLADEDTYIYLTSISGLVACARFRSDLVLEALTKEFSLVQTRKLEQDQSEEEMMTVRTKVGEALVKITKELGEMTPKYKNLLLNSFFSTANDPDPLVRASGLSNLGEVCSLLRFSLGPVTGELLLHLSACSRDVATEVRAAAVMVLTMTLQGLGRDVFSVLQGTLRDVYRELKLLAQTEKEDVVLSHVSLALQEIDNIVRQFLTPDTSQDKKIFVLN